MRSRIKSKSLRKKAEESSSALWMNVIGIIILALVLVPIVMFISNQIAVFTDKKSSESSINNFKSISSRVEELLRSDRDFAFSTILYSITDNFAIAGFNYKNSDPLRTTHPRDAIVEQKRPSQCRNKACLCLFKDSNDPLASTLVPQCTVLDQNVVFLTSVNSAYDGFCGARTGWDPQLNGQRYYPSQTSYEFLIVYGDACTILRDFNVRNLYIEKYKIGDTVFFYVAEIKREPSHPSALRAKYMQDQFERISARVRT